MIVAMLFAVLPSGAALAEQIRVPEPSAKPKVVKKQVRRNFRPTMPVRNPVRPVVEPSDETIVVTNLLPPPDPFEAAETQPAEAQAPETLASETDQASDTASSEEPDEVTEIAEETSDETAEPTIVVTDLSPPDDPFVPAPDVEEPDEVAEDASNEPAQTDSAEASEETEEETEIVEAPSHDATVVIAVLPPEEVAAAEVPEAETPADDEPIETAVVTPPSEPAPVPVVSDSDEKSEASEAEPAPDAEQSETSESEPAPSDAETVETTPVEAELVPDDASETASSDDETEELVETVPEVVEPPAHPVVAAIRVTLADPSFRKSVRPAALKGLEGLYGTREEAPLWITDSGFSTNAQTLIGEIGKANDWGLDARAFDVPDAGDQHATVEEQAAAELKLDMAILKYARFAQGGRLSPKRVSKLFDQRPKFRDSKTVLVDLAAADVPSDYLLSLHPQHKQFKGLQAALVKARTNNNTRDVQHIAINMERWRWVPRQLGSYYVLNNVPEFNTRVVKNGKVIYVEKTIVGQLKYATPFFSAPMRNIVIHPDWTLPPTILNEDIAPNLKKPKTLFGGSNTAILRHHKIRVSYKGETINPDKVDWNKVNIHEYRFTQASGPANVLGNFKFNFPNRHAIYMHDTQERGLFSERVRTFSHGCIRVHDPARLAALLLAEDKGWPASRVDALVAQGENTVVAFRRPVPVHLTYFTATVGPDGRLQTFTDIYGLDGLMAPKLFDKPVHFQAPANSVVAGTNTRNRGPSNRRTGGGLGGLISGLFGN